MKVTIKNDACEHVVNVTKDLLALHTMFQYQDYDRVVNRVDLCLSCSDDELLQLASALSGSFTSAFTDSVLYSLNSQLHIKK